MRIILSKAEELFLSWAKKAAVPIELSWTSSLSSFACDLVESQLRDKKIVFLGEPDHFVIEKYQYQLSFLRRLHELGWNLVGKEIGRSDGERINRFIQTGNESCLNSVVLFGASDSNGAVRRMSPAGLMSPVPDSGVSSFRSAEIQLARALRDLAKSADIGGSIRFFGFDIDIFPGGALADITELLAQSTDLGVSAQLLANLAPRPGETVSDERMRLEHAFKQAQLLEGRLEMSIGIDDTKALIGTLQNWLNGVEFLERAFLNPTREELWSAFAYREHTMIREVCDLLSDNNISKKLVLLGHNMHLTKKSDQITSFNLCGQQVPMWNSVGTYIAEKFRDQVFSVWMLCGSGTHSGPHFSSSQQSFSNLDLFVEAILSSVPWHAFCLPLSSAPNIVLESLSETMFGCNGEPAQGSLRAQADMIVFIREVTAL